MPLYTTIEKPTLLLDERTARANIHHMALKARAAGVAFRPHFKTHQSAEIGSWFRAEGVETITVSSLDMAVYFANAGWQDITLAFSANLRQMEGMQALARRIHLGLLAESVETVSALGRRLETPVDLWLKIDSGTGRTGLRWDRVEEILAVARRALEFSHLRLRGLLTHAGNTYAARDPQAAAGVSAVSTARLNRLRSHLEAAGIPPLLVSTGDTPGCSASENFPGVDEIRPGNFIFYDAKQAASGACRWEDIAVALACPVVALHPDRAEAVIYGGAIHLSTESFDWEGSRCMGWVALPPSESPQFGENLRWGKPLPGATVARLSQEHGILRLQPADLVQLQVGDLVCILPAHSCLTAQCMGSYLTLSGRRVEMMRS
jgi:D-serine deaminase-like pyridoxal phosphate-dependent protein